MKGRIKTPLLWGDEGLGVAANYVRLWPSGSENYLLWVIVAVGHENNWEQLKCPIARQSFFLGN